MPDENFPNTSWTLIARAGELSPEGRAALSALCKSYRDPVYAFIRRRGGSHDDAQDRTQEFFARLLARNDFAKVDRARGSKFRSWLLQCVKNYLNNDYDHAHAQRRVPPEMLESISYGNAEGHDEVDIPDHITPERVYERQFALRLLELVLDKLHAKYASAGKERLFEALKGSLSGDVSLRPHEEIAASLGMTVGAVKKAAFDLRGHYKTIFRAEVTELVDAEGPAGEAAVEEELRHLLAALSDE